MPHDFAARAEFRGKGHYYEDFEIGRAFPHHWGRTINEGDNTLFASLTLNFNPLYYNVEFAKAPGHKAIVVCPMLVFGTVFGMSVEDLCENGGAFLGVENLIFHQPVYPGDTLTAEFDRDRPAGVVVQQGRRHCHLGDTRLQPARRTRHRFQAHQHGHTENTGTLMTILTPNNR